jgi:5-methylcytosine-specific restriction protein A
MVKLHDEIRDILLEHGAREMTTNQIAEIVNGRGLYRKRDGTPVTAFQIHGRTRKRPELFDRDGSRVSLKSSEIRNGEE